MSDMAYAVHTRTCTYLLDDEGVCRWVLSPTGTIPPDGQRSVGAQFVACLDLRVAGGLVGELLIGASILFVRRDDDSGRLHLLRTSPIEYVEFKKPAEILSGADAAPEPPPLASDEPTDEDAEPIDPDEMVTYQGGAVTLTMPLFRPDAQPSGRDPHRRKIPAPPISDEALSKGRGTQRNRRR